MKKLLATLTILASLGGYALATELPVYQPAELTSGVLPTYMQSLVDGSDILPTLSPARKLGNSGEDILPTVVPAQKRWSVKSDRR